MINQLKIYNVGQKIRVGKTENDGGYVLPKQLLEDSECLFSYGISNDISFDENYIQLTDKKVYGYDHTIEGIDTNYPEHFTLYKKGLSGTPQEQTDNFLNHYKELGISGKVLLKVDVEGCEYEWLSNTNINELKSIVTGLTMEFHNLNNLSVLNQFFEIVTELNKHFYICHIHGNNCSGQFIYHEGDGDVLFPEVLEITFINKEIVTSAELDYSKYPGELDIPNAHHLPDFDLPFTHPDYVPKSMIKTYKDLKGRKWEGEGIPKWIFKTGPFKLENLPELYKHLFLDMLEKNPGYELFYFSDEDCMLSIHDSFGEGHFRTYDNVLATAYKADFWRYCILHTYGGCYGDFSQVMLTSFDSIIEDMDRVLVVDTPEASDALYNAFMCVKPGDTVVKRAIDISKYKIDNKIYGVNTLDITGPRVLGKAYCDIVFNGRQGPIHIGVHGTTKILNNYQMHSNFIVDFEGNHLILKKLQNHFHSVYYDRGMKHYGQMWEERIVFRP